VKDSEALMFVHETMLLLKEMAASLSEIRGSAFSSPQPHPCLQLSSSLALPHSSTTPPFNAQYVSVCLPSCFNHTHDIGSHAFTEYWLLPEEQHKVTSISNPPEEHVLLFVQTKRKLLHP
jgi:hypothetical protein